MGFASFLEDISLRATEAWGVAGGYASASCTRRGGPEFRSHYPMPVRVLSAAPANLPAIDSS
jgi:hypothetical protein